VEHLREVREEFGEEAPVRKISDALVDFLTDRSLPIPEELLMEKDGSVIISRTQVMKAVAERMEEDRLEAGIDETIDEGSTNITGTSLRK